MAKRGSWATRLGFYLAAIGSACGLGNLWRFPYVVGENGGGAFVLLYVLLALIIGLPLLVGELMLGQSTGKSVISALDSIRSEKNYQFVRIGKASLILCVFVLSYYAVVSGWVLHFAVQFLSVIVKAKEASELGPLSSLLKNGMLQIGLASVHLLFSMIIVVKGVQEGLERFIGWTIPIFGILLVVLTFESMSLPAASEALRFLFYPDFSKLKLSSLIQAIGHVLFTLSIGFGTMVTFGSYMKETEHIPTAGFRVTLIDTLISLVAGLLVFPIALQASNIPLTDAGLLFESLPQFLLQMPGGVIFGFLFFVCFYLAALAASIGILEVIVSNLVDRRRYSRKVAAWLASGIALLVGVLPAFSGSTFHAIKIWNKGILENLDYIVINWVLPVIALFMAFAISKGLKQTEKEALFIHPTKVESNSLYKLWTDAVRYVVPGVIILGIILQIISIIKSSIQG